MTTPWHEIDPATRRHRPRWRASDALALALYGGGEIWTDQGALHSDWTMMGDMEIWAAVRSVCCELPTTQCINAAVRRGLVQWERRFKTGEDVELKLTRAGRERGAQLWQQVHEDANRDDSLA